MYTKARLVVACGVVRIFVTVFYVENIMNVTLDVVAPSCLSHTIDASQSLAITAQGWTLQE